MFTHVAKCSGMFHVPDFINDTKPIRVLACDSKQSKNLQTQNNAKCKQSFALGELRMSSKPDKENSFFCSLVPTVLHSF